MMSKYIVLTTINYPTDAIKKFIAKKDWITVIVGDLQTSHEEYKKLQGSNVVYLSPEDQDIIAPELSEKIGWKCIQRKNLGILYAYKKGADIIALLDDDNIPYDSWGQNILVNKEVYLDCYEPETPVFDPLAVTQYKNLWHRGYPLSLVTGFNSNKNNIRYIGKTKRKVLVQAELWNGDPDIDAITRIVLHPEVKFDIQEFFCSNKIGPFNSQNTFLSREVIPFYFLFPFVGRMDDIWASYLVQNRFPNSVIYGPASVYQLRNQHNLIKDLEQELLGYKYNMQLIENLNNFENFLSNLDLKKTLEAWNTYRSYFVI